MVSYSSEGVQVNVPGGATVRPLFSRMAAGAASPVRHVYSMFGGESGVGYESSFRDESGRLILPDPVLADEEVRLLDELTVRYEAFVKPTRIATLAQKASDLIPLRVKSGAAAARETVASQRYYVEAMKYAVNGLGELENRAASVSVGPDYVLTQVNAGLEGCAVAGLREIVLLRATDVSRIARRDQSQHLALAFMEGGATGFFGFAGIPFNLALSNFLMFRAVQSVAMFYGYDVKGDPAEMEVAASVLMSSFSPDARDGAGARGEGGSGIEAMIGKVLIFAEVTAVKQTATKGWAAMAEHGGITLVLTQIRALANAAARKALEKSGQKALEVSVFRGVLEQLGRRMTLNNVGRIVPGVGAAVGAVIDVGAMKKAVEFADIFYAKRFILEKPLRVAALDEPTARDSLGGRTSGGQGADERS